MKKVTLSLVTAILSIVCSFTYAQQVLIVNPGTGTLNTAIDQYQGTRIYQLKAGEWYQLSKPIENAGFDLKIIGEVPANNGMPATLQTNFDVNNATFGSMFNAKGNLTIKNVYIVNADMNSTVGNVCIANQLLNNRIIVDNCVIHPAAVSFFLVDQAGNTKTYFTNNQAIDHGHQTSPNDGNFFAYGGAGMAGLDTLLVENNTFVCMGMNMFSGDFTSSRHNFVKWNHNTFCMTKSQFDWAVFKNEEYWTNNLFWDAQTQPYMNTWQPMPGGDPARPKPNLIYGDTLPGEVLPSIRTNFVEFNSFGRQQGFYDLLAEMNTWAKANAKPLGYLYDLTWSKDSVNCREAQMFNSTGFPNFKYGNTLRDVDPQWVDSKIYDHGTSMIAWTRPASFIHGFGRAATDFPAASQWTQYWWIPSGDISNNSVWPVFNGKYTNPQTLTGSIENLPLGDLNWFPTQKALWLSKKPQIEAYIKAGNTTKMNLTAIPVLLENSTMIYPNPAKDEIILKGVQNAEVTILSLDGRTLKNIKNVSKVNVSDIANGSYLISIKEGNRISTQKLLIQR
ncbi:MAG: T9SS type A sorting domain-containing protein [Paludibacter sp.]